MDAVDATANQDTARGEPHHNLWISAAGHPNETGVKLTILLEHSVGIPKGNELTRNQKYHASVTV